MHLPPADKQKPKSDAGKSKSAFGKACWASKFANSQTKNRGTAVLVWKTKRLSKPRIFSENSFDLFASWE